MQKAIGMYIFGGSHAIGVMQSGYKIDRILEISNDILETNSYHFSKNYPDIPIILPSIWKENNYVDNLKFNDYDLLFANNPCSGLSRINVNASSTNEVNKYFYDVIGTINKLQPKRFLMENAPTLVTIGFPILTDIVNTLGQSYYINIMNDNAGNHSVPMIRPRTIITGYRKDIYDGVPIYEPDKQVMTTVKMSIGDLYDTDYAKQIFNTDDYISHYAESLRPYYNRVKPKQSVMEMLVENPQYDSELPFDWQRDRLKHFREKIAMGKGYWDKFPKRLDENYTAPSLTSASLLIHPKYDRDLNVREYARLMCYPDNFKFYISDECKISPIQCIAQGVPVNFIRYVLSQMNKVEHGDGRLFTDYAIAYQNNVHLSYNLSNIFNKESLLTKYNISGIFNKKRNKLF